MKNQKSISNSKIIGRKKFFSNFGKGLMAGIVFTSIPFKIFSKNGRKVKIEINPSAVRRKKVRPNG